MIGPNLIGDQIAFGGRMAKYLEFDFDPQGRLAPQPARQRTPEGVFSALDGSEINASGHRWAVEVYSVTDQPSGRWLQLGLKDDEHQDHLLTLRLPSGSGTETASRALSSWLTDPSQVAEIVHVA